MSDQGEKTCPLCAEEMDLTDQHLRPCKCGYEICVWCWHHIMEMAEKDETEGRCPACRTPYDKEKIVGTKANCERVVAEVNMEKKIKSQKARIKTSESRKQLSTVRVIQRNLVYIVGLPLDLADEDLLQRQDYFGMYGRVLKVSISQTSAGTIQQFANNTCSVYITYGMEEEAIRCIQSVHGFILDGRPLRACFGTTKYCLAWLRNVPCSNPECLYLHEIGMQEDSFSKDEIISAYTRSRVQQITGFTNNMQRSSGNMLPPPSDDYCINTSAVNAASKHPSNNPASNTKCSTSNSSSGILPAAASWGARASTCSQSAASIICANGTKQKADLINSSLTLPIASSVSTRASILPTNIRKKLINEDTYAMQSKHGSEKIDSLKQHDERISQTSISEISSRLARSVVKTISQPSCHATADSEPGNGKLDRELCADEQQSLDVDRTESSVNDGKIQNLPSVISSVTVDDQLIRKHSEVLRPDGLCLDNFLSHRSQDLQRHDPGENKHPATAAVSTTVGSFNAASAPGDVGEWEFNSMAPGIKGFPCESEDDFDSQRVTDAVVVTQTTSPMSSPLNLLSHLRGSSQLPVAAVHYPFNSSIVHKIHDDGSGAITEGVRVASNRSVENFVSGVSGQCNSCSLVNVEQRNQIMGRYDVLLASNDSLPATDMGESSIISNILELDSWDVSLTSPQNLAKLLGDTEKQEAPMNLANSSKGQNSNQSRFSFARQEEPINQLFDFESSIGNSGQALKNQSFGWEFADNQDSFMDRLGNSVGFPQRNFARSENLTSSHFGIPPSKISSSGSRSQISAPPGFTTPSRTPPPGFSSYERTDQTYDMKSGNHFHKTPSLLRNSYLASQSTNINTGNDFEFMDPAILAVGKGRLHNGINNSGVDMRPNFHVQTPSLENESRLQLLLQRSLSPHQALRYSEVKDNFSPPNDYGFSSRHMEQSLSSNLPPFSQFSLQQALNNIVSNGHWGGWNETQSANDMGRAELLRGDGLGFNKFRMADSGDLYNSSFRM